MEMVRVEQTAGGTKQEIDYIMGRLRHYGEMLKEIEEGVKDHLRGEPISLEEIAATRDALQGVAATMEVIVHRWAFKAAPLAAKLLNRLNWVMLALNQLELQQPKQLMS